ncbi:MAG: M48 family metalloprotease, partial [Planctomycetales bacterium]|nr:M48 family metalloprotease [Planctomycetales bacterium]
MGLNAAVTGLVRPFRYVLLSDALLQRLSQQEIVAVFGHELGHVRHLHLPLRVMTIVAPVSLCLLVHQAAPEIAGPFMALLSAQGAAVQALVAVLATAAATAYILVVFGCYSRLLEHQADLFGCRWVSSNPEFPAVDTF